MNQEKDETVSMEEEVRIYCCNSIVHLFLLLLLNLIFFLSLIKNKDVGGASETTTNSGSNKHQAQTDDDEEEDEPVYIESSPCSRWQKRRETVCFYFSFEN